MAWYTKNSGDKTLPVGQRLANAYGLYDMSGNITEWQQDWYDKEQNARVIRSGSWIDNVSDVRVTYRYRYDQEVVKYYYIGFRLARTLP